MSWTERATNWVKQQLNISSEELEPMNETTKQNIRILYMNATVRYWRDAYEAYLNDDELPSPFPIIDRNEENLPNPVKEAITYYMEQIERNDLGTVQLRELDIHKAFIVSTTTDGDDGWIELYSEKGQAIGYGRTFIELISWGEKDAIRKMTLDSSFPADMEDRFERTLWKGDIA